MSTTELETKRKQLAEVEAALHRARTGTQISSITRGGRSTQFDTPTIAELEAAASQLRDEIARLEGGRTRRVMHGVLPGR